MLDLPSLTHVDVSSSPGLKGGAGSAPGGLVNQNPAARAAAPFGCLNLDTAQAAAFFLVLVLSPSWVPAAFELELETATKYCSMGTVRKKVNCAFQVRGPVPAAFMPSIRLEARI